MNAHPFLLFLDEDSLHGHVFGTLKVRVEDGVWEAVERRCRLCNRLPIELLTIGGSIAECVGWSNARAREEWLD